jgi:rhamnosyltransferase
MSENVQHVFLVGAKSLGAYGGYETFINKLTEYHQHDARIKYHVACKANGDGCMDETKVDGVSDVVKKDGETVEFTYHNAQCFKIKIPEKLGSAQAIYYDVKALEECCNYIKEEKIEHPIVYIMACRIGVFMRHFYKEIHKLGGKVYLNPDGHEWMRAKWSKPVRKYWKFSEQMMVKYCDLIICDSVTIEKYIHECYDGKGIGGKNPRTTFIAYGAETRESKLADDDPKLLGWYQSKGVAPHNYFLVVGRFVPENNYETMIAEFMKSKSKHDFVIITNVNDKFLDELESKLHFRKDSRIKFVGTVYDQELLMKIRENAYGYFHGHEVGGTNPSLLEALESTDLNLLLDVGFNREVAEDAALYWEKTEGSLSELIDKADALSVHQIMELSEKAKNRIRNAYSWQYIADRYESVLLQNPKQKVNMVS